MQVNFFNRPFLTSEIIIGYSKPDIHLWLFDDSLYGELVFVSGIKIMPGGDAYEVL